MKTLIYGWASYKIPDKTGVDPENLDRQTLYAISLRQLLASAPKDTGIVIADNTVSKVSELHPVLQKELQDPRITRLVLVDQNTVGLKNVGMGEHATCLEAIRQTQDIIPNYDWLVYYTSRQVMSFPLLFQYLQKHADKQAIVGATSHFYPDGSELPCAPGNFNDMLFAMKRDVFLRYVQSMDPAKNAALGLNSEQCLYRFIMDNKIDFAEIHHWGLFRYDYHAGTMHIT